MMTGLLCVVCVLVIMWGIDSGWPWWTFVPLSMGTVVFFFADRDDDF